MNWEYEMSCSRDVITGEQMVSTAIHEGLKLIAIVREDGHVSWIDL